MAWCCTCPGQKPLAGTWRSRSAPTSAHTGPSGWGQQCPALQAVFWWPPAMAEAPKEHRGVPGVVSGSWVLQGPSSRGFGVLRGSVPPGRSQEQRRLGTEVGDCWQRTRLWPRAGAPPGTVLSTGSASAPRCAHGAAWLRWVQPRRQCQASGLGVQSGWHTRSPGAGSHGGRRGVGDAGGTASLLGAGLSQATSGHRCRMGH